MALPEFSMRQLLEAGVHFGHQTHRWNPKMAPYIFGERSNIHIMDLSQTVPLLHQALVKARDVAASGGRIMFVGTKRQASDVIAESAQRCAQYYVNHRWLGGMMTNWQTITNSITRLRELEALFENEAESGLTKKELLKRTRELTKLTRALGGIKDMGGIPSLMFVVDTNKESIAIKEARKLGIPVIAILDTNCNPDDADFPIPGNDDASRAIGLYCDLLADAILDGMAEGAAKAGVDLGAMENPVELALEAAPVVEEKPAAEEKPAVKVEKKPAAKKIEVPVEAKPAAAKPAKAKPAETKPAETKPTETKEDDVSLIDGVGPTYAKKLIAAGITTFKAIAALDDAAVEALEAEHNFAGKIISGEWRIQAQELLDGKPPRAKIDQAKADKA